MIQSKAKHAIKTRIGRYGTTYTSGDDSFKGMLSKSDVARDLPRSEYTIHVAYNATINNGELIVDSTNDQRYVPVMIDSSNLAENNLLKKAYLLQANASGTIKSFVDVSNASYDEWGEPEGTEGTDWGWLTKKNRVWVSFERLSLRSDVEEIGAIEGATYRIVIPWSVNASYTPLPEDRFTTTAGDNWKIEDIDDYTHKDQAYVALVSPDNRET